MGDNVWRDEDAWPPTRARIERFHLTGPAAEADNAAGALTADQPSTGTGFSAFDFNPSDPVPTVGGATFLPGAYIGLHAGQRDQHTVEQRPDVVTFTSAVLNHDLELGGPVAVVLHASTSAPDTDWTAKLVDVHPDGRALNVCDGIIRARYRTGAADEELLTPDEVHEFRIDLGATSIVLPAGHALRLEISSSNFPRFDINPNSGGPTAAASRADFVVAHQKIWHDRRRPSHLEVHVVPRP
jgi:putative CocE/NonD family hydrolase